MFGSGSKVLRWQKVPFVCLLAGCLFWNAWFIGGLQHGLSSYTSTSISQLNDAGRPYSAMFTFLEFLSGGLLLIASVCYLVSKPRLVLAGVMASLIGVIGLLTIYGAANPPDCVRYQGMVCQRQDDTIYAVNRRHYTETVITAYLTMILAVLVGIEAFVGSYGGGEFRMLAIATAVVMFGSLGVLDSTDGILAHAIAERMWNSLVSIDFLILAYLTARSSTFQLVSNRDT